jgi:limonene-1,2-epoxide hydrolase
MATSEENAATVGAFYDALYRQDFPAVVAHFAPDGEYTDVVTPADDVAVGGEQITARLTLAFGRLESLADDRLRMIAGDDAVFTEHVEHWRWPTGETMDLLVGSVHELRDAKITRWRDYWDMAVLLAAAPQWWMEYVMGGWR